MAHVRRARYAVVGAFLFAMVVGGFLSVAGALAAAKAPASGQTELAARNAAPVNDNFANATDIPGPGAYSGTTIEATSEPEETWPGPAQQGATVWYNFTPSASQVYLVNVPDMNVTIYTGSGFSIIGQGLEQVATNGVTTNPISFSGSSGVTYRIQVMPPDGIGRQFSLTLMIPPRDTNDNFLDAAVISGPGVYGGTTIGATLEPGEPAHWPYPVTWGDTSVWYKYTPSTLVQISATVDDALTGAFIYTGTALNNLTRLQGGRAYPGNTYYIAVSGRENHESDFTLTFSAVPIIPGNDNFANRITLPSAGTHGGSTVNATTEFGEPSHGIAGPARSVWWRYTPTSNGPVTLDTVQSNFDTVLAVYSGNALYALTSVTTNDNIDSLANTRSRVTFQGVAGTSYAIAVAAKGDNVGQVMLTVLTTPQANDNFVNATVINQPGTLPGSNRNSTGETGEPAHAGLSGARSSVWWRYTPSTSGPVTVDTLQSDFNTVLAVYTGSSVNALTPIASNNNANAETRRSKLTFSGVAGTTYRIAVSGETVAMQGNVQLRVFGGTSIPGPTILAAVAPSARATTMNSPVTAFATVLNAGAGAATGCHVVKSALSVATLSYRTMNGNQFGPPDTPADIPANGRQDFLLIFDAAQAMQSNLALIFDCTNAPSAPSVPGVNTFLFTVATPSPADIISVIATPSGDGILNVPVSGTGSASLAAQNIGSPRALQARLATSAIGAPGAILPVTITMCRTDPSNGACLAPPGGTPVDFLLQTNAVATFAVFLTYDGTAIPFDPASKRLFVHFYQGSTPVGSSSVAVRTMPAGGSSAASVR